MATLDELIVCIDDPEDDSTRAYEIVDDLVASGDHTLIPSLTAQLERFLDEGHFYGRDVIADVLAGLAGLVALPSLVRAAARDLGDDQDSLRSTIMELMYETSAGARPVIDALRDDPDHSVRAVAAWAGAYLDELRAAPAHSHGN